MKRIELQFEENSNSIFNQPHFKSEVKKRKLWQYGLWSFQTGGTKLERFLPKNQNTKEIIIEF